MALNNPHPRDSNITFDDASHTYTVDGNSSYTSVTSLIKKYFFPFNADLIIKKIKASNNWGPDNQYWNMTNEEIKQAWDRNGKEAAQAGTLMHLNIQNYYNGKPMTDEFKESKEYAQFEQFLRDHPDYKPLRTEWPVYSKKYLLAGSIDIVYIDPKDDSKVILADWKRCKEIKFDNKWEKGIGPLKDIDNCNYWHYCLQLNTYRMILEKYYDKEVSIMFLVILHPNQETYQKINIPRVSEPILNMLMDYSSGSGPGIQRTPKRIN